MECCLLHFLNRNLRINLSQFLASIIAHSGIECAWRHVLRCCTWFGYRLKFELNFFFFSLSSCFLYLPSIFHLWYGLWKPALCICKQQKSEPVYAPSGWLCNLFLLFDQSEDPDSLQMPSKSSNQTTRMLQHFCSVYFLGLQNVGFLVPWVHLIYNRDME